MFYEQYFDVKALCEEYYSKKKMEHAKAVESYVIKDTRYALLSIEDQWSIRSIALAHDLLEDTKCTYEQLKDISCFMAESVMLLTHFKECDSYYDYVKKIVDSKNILAIIVKTADLKDHLMRKQTLTPKLVAKYDQVIPLLLKA